MTEAGGAPIDFARDYRAPWWLPGGHAQTIWPAIASRRDVLLPAYRRERWTTPDGDFVDVDRRQGASENAPLLVLFHGLEGSSSSPYAHAFARRAAEAGWAFAVPHFRGCSGELNLAPRAYHSGDFAEVGWMLERFAAEASRPMHAAGVSLGGNALMCWAAEAGDAARRIVRSTAAVCAPLDLAAGGRALGAGFARQVYTRIFLRTMKSKALAKLAQHPGLFDLERIQAAGDLHAFDDVFTAPLHGFEDADAYWSKASAKPYLHRIRVPALLLNALNDPFVPARSLPGADEAGPCVTLWQPRQGGHVGFPVRSGAGRRMTMPSAVIDWMRSHG